MGENEGVLVSPGSGLSPGEVVKLLVGVEVACPDAVTSPPAAKILGEHVDDEVTTVEVPSRELAHVKMGSP